MDDMTEHVGQARQDGVDVPGEMELMLGRPPLLDGGVKCVSRQWSRPRLQLGVAS